MEYAISYFYKIRYFEPNMIPFSTAMSDPKWFHANRDADTVFIDKHGVVNGIRLPELAPGTSCQNLCRGKNYCTELNSTDGGQSDIPNCAFIRAYSAQLDKLNFSHLTAFVSRMAFTMQGLLQFEGDPIAVLIVYETPDNPCSERAPLQSWFRQNGILLPELKV